MGKFRILAAAAGFLLVLKMPVRAQNPEDVSPPPVAADQAQDQGQAAADNGGAQMLGDTNWWLENDGLTFGYLAGGYGYGYGMGSCGGSSRAGGHGAAWWNAGGTNAWLPAGQQLPYPYGSGWCGSNYSPYGNYGYALTANQLIVPNRHRHAWKHNLGFNPKASGTKNQTLASATKTPRASNSNEGPDDDWVRVEDHVEPSHGAEAAAAAGSRPRTAQPIAGDGTGRPQTQGAHTAHMRGPTHRGPAQPGTVAHPHIAAHPAAHVATHVVVRAGGRTHS
jgi:hypothetical protein